MSILKIVREADTSSVMARAQQFAAAGKTAEAFTHYRALCCVEPQHPEAHYNMAAILLQNDQHRAALGYALTAFETDKSNVLFRVMLATALAGVNALQQAESILSPVDVTGPMGQFVFNLRNNIDLAKREAGRQLASIPVDIEALQKRSETGSISDAKFGSTILSMILSDLQNRDSWIWLHLHHNARNEHMLSEAAAHRAHSIAPKSAKSRAALAYVYDAMGEPAFAADLYDDALAKGVHDATFIRQYSGFLIQSGKNRWQDADRLLDEYTERYGDNAEYALSHGVAKDLLGMADEARALFAKAISLPDAKPGTFIPVVTTLLQGQTPAKAREAVDLALSRFGEHPIALGLDGIVATSEKRFDRAVAAFDRIQGATVPLNLDALVQFSYGKAQDKLGRFESAHAAFARGNASRAHEFAVEKRFGANKPLASSKAIAETFKRDWVDTWAEIDAPGTMPRHAVIAGLPRSGTTLLDTILRAHGAFELLEEEPAMNLAFSALIGRVGGWPSLAAIDQAEVGRFRTEYKEAVEHILDRSLSADDYLIDRHPGNTSLVGAISRMLPDTKIIFIARHPLDVILSGFMQDFALGEATANLLSIEKAATYYETTMKAFDASVEATGLDVHVVRYEDLVADTEGEMRRILAFLEVEWRDAVLDHQGAALKRDRIRTASFDQVRQPIYQTSRYRWKNYRFALEMHMDQVRPWIEKFGYDSDQ